MHTAAISTIIARLLNSICYLKIAHLNHHIWHYMMFKNLKQNLFSYNYHLLFPFYYEIKTGLHHKRLTNTNILFFLKYYFAY